MQNSNKQWSRSVRGHQFSSDTLSRPLSPVFRPKRQLVVTPPFNVQLNHGGHLSIKKK